MPSLSSLIVQRQIATVQEVEQAIARQVIHGGDLVTNLLEVAPSCEAGVNAVLGESVGLPPAPWGRLQAPDSDVLALVPAELCLAHTFFPLRLERGTNLVIATPSPLAPSVEDTLRFSLQRALTQAAAPTIRVREGIAAHYGIPLDPRQLRLIQKLDDAHRLDTRSRSDARARSAPPIGYGEGGPLSLPKVPSVIPSTFSSGVPSEAPASNSLGTAAVMTQLAAQAVAQITPPSMGPPSEPVSSEPVSSEPVSSESPSDRPTPTGEPEASVRSVALENELHERSASKTSILGTAVAETEPLRDPAATTQPEWEPKELEPDLDVARAGDATPASAASPPASAAPVTVEPTGSDVLGGDAVEPERVRPITLIDDIVEQRADSMLALEEPASQPGVQGPVRHDTQEDVRVPDPHLRDTVPTEIDAVEAMEAAAMREIHDPLHPDAVTRHAPEVVSSFAEASALEESGAEDTAPGVLPSEDLAPPTPPLATPAFATEPPAHSDTRDDEPAPLPPAVATTDGPADAAPATEHDAPPSTQPSSEPDIESPAPPSIVNPRAIAALIKRELGAKRGKSARRKGPFARSDAEKELEAAATPDELIDIFFAFVSQFFEYGALFLVHADIAEGRDAFGPGAPREKVLGIGVPLDLPSAFARAREQGVVVFTRMHEEALDMELRADLARQRNVPTQVAIVPLMLRNRTVALLYGDDGSSDVTVSQLGDLFGFSALASTHLERIALSKKRGAAGAPRRKAEASNVHALARALSLPGAPSVEAPASVMVSPGARSVQPPPYDPPPPEAMGSSPFEAAPVDRARPTAFADTMAADALGMGPSGAGAASSESDPARAPAPSASNASITRDYDDVAFAQRLGEPGQLGSAPPRRSDSTDPNTLAGTGRAADPGSGAPGPSPRAHTREVTADVEDDWLEPGSTAQAKAREDDLDSQGKGLETRVTGPGKTTRLHESLPREEEEDATTWLVEQQGDTPAPSRGFGQRRAEYAIIADRSQPPETSFEAQRAREGVYGPYGPVLMKALRGGIHAEEALAELAREAEHSLSKMVAAFPGPLLVDRFRLRDQLPPASECGPLLKLLVMLRRAALGFMTVRSTAADMEQRFWATHVLGELLFPEASPAVLPRLFDDDVMVRRVARRAAAALVHAGAAGEPLRVSLDNMIVSRDEPVHRRVLAIEATGEIRAAQMLPVLIRALETPSDSVVEAAHCSLLLISRQDLGQSPLAWDAWWEANKHRHRLEWLIDALTHETPGLRRAAGDELKQITKEYFGYYDDLPSRERERAQQKYRDWWNEEGQFRFH